MHPMSDKEMKEAELKYRAQCAADDLVRAENHKKDKELMKHVKSELKERSKALEAAMGKKKQSDSNPKKQSKPAPKKKK